MIIKKNPFDLLNYRRFDVPAKYIYAKFREKGIAINWHKELYKEHIRVINGGFEIIDPPKDNINDFLFHFDNLLDSIKKNNYDSKKFIPITKDNCILDGSHRLAACLLYGINPLCKVINKKGYNLSHNFFKNRKRYVSTGLINQWSDPMAIEYAKLKKNTYLVMIFPSALAKDKEINNILLEHGNIVYERKINIKKYGKINLIRKIYPDEWWLGGCKDGFIGAKRKADWCFRNNGPVRIYLIESDNLLNIKSIKEKIRELFSLDKMVSSQKKLARSSAVHINDYNEETIKLSQLLFNENGIHFLNNSKPAYFKKFEKNLKKLKKWINENNLDPEDFCVVGSSCLALYGIRDSNDLDILHFKDIIPIHEKEIGSHNNSIKNYSKEKDEIIFNPENYLVYDGIKFASINIIKNMKIQRNEIKDRIDLKLIEDFIDKEAPLDENENNKYNLMRFILNSTLFQKTNYLIDKTHRLTLYSIKKLCKKK